MSVSLAIVPFNMMSYMYSYSIILCQTNEEMHNQQMNLKADFPKYNPFMTSNYFCWEVNILRIYYCKEKMAWLFCLKQYYAIMRTLAVVMNEATISWSIWLSIFIERCHMYILHEVAVNESKVLGGSCVFSRPYTLYLWLNCVLSV